VTLGTAIGQLLPNHINSIPTDAPCAVSKGMSQPYLDH
jgi:hypothetical protein